MDTSIGVDLLVVYLQNFADGQVDPFGHLLCQLAIQVPEFLVRATEGFHHFRPHRTLRRYNAMNVMGDGFLQQKSLRLSVFFGDRDEFLVELCIDGGTDLDRRPVGHSKPLATIVDLLTWRYQDKSRFS